MKTALLLAAIVALSNGAFAQTPAIPRAADGRPDFQGVWMSGSLTPVLLGAGAIRMTGARGLWILISSVSASEKPMRTMRAPQDEGESTPKDLTPQPPSLRGKGEQKAPSPSGGGVFRNSTA